MPSLCQPNSIRFSCGACCGLLNLNLEKSQLNELLYSRTNEFKNNVSYSKKETVIQFREKRESIERTIPKHSPETYVCPFLGFMDNSKIGCMIHPTKTDDPFSQNFSFYGSSICQTYDCKNKERKNVNHWIELLRELPLSSIEYSQLASNHILFSLLEKTFSISDKEPIQSEVKQIIKKIFIYVLKKNLSNSSTSFEIDYDLQESNHFEKLILFLKINQEDELFKEIEKLM